MQRIQVTWLKCRGAKTRSGTFRGASPSLEMLWAHQPWAAGSRELCSIAIRCHLVQGKRDGTHYFGVVYLDSYHACLHINVVHIPYKELVGNMGYIFWRQQATKNFVSRKVLVVMVVNTNVNCYQQLVKNKLFKSIFFYVYGILRSRFCEFLKT